MAERRSLLFADCLTRSDLPGAPESVLRVLSRLFAARAEWQKFLSHATRVLPAELE